MEYGANKFGTPQSSFTKHTLKHNVSYIKKHKECLSDLQTCYNLQSIQRTVHMEYGANVQRIEKPRHQSVYMEG